ncbi:LOW QUALITY PROTEIN: hypothetical protein T265_14057, partial [Opisthorchis viverrini]
LTTLLIFYPLVYCARRQCFNLEQELSYCSQKLKVKMPVNQLAGYSFGYGSLNDTEYMCRDYFVKNDGLFSWAKLLTRLLKTLRHPTTGFGLLGAHQVDTVPEFPPTSCSTECAAHRPPHDSVGTIFEISQHIFIKVTNPKVAENSSTAHDRFRPSWARQALSPIFRQPHVLVDPKLDCFREIHSFATECAAHRPPHDSVGTIFEISQHIFIKVTNPKVAENPSTAHDRFRPSWARQWHILVFHCMRKRSEEACRNSEEEMFKQLIWSISLETRKLERAAAYMCHEHNLR